MENSRCVSLWLGMFLQFIIYHDFLAAGVQDLCGSNFVFAFPPNLHPEDNVFQVVLTPCSSSSRTVVNVSTPSHELDYFSTHTLTNSEGLTVTLPKEIATERDAFFISGTVVISTDNEISVVAVSGQIRTMATFPIIPTISLGQEYVVVSYANPEEKTALPAEFVISSLSESTHVTLQLTGDALSSTDWSVQYPATEEISIDLFSYDSVLLRSDQGLTGSRIWSDKPVSVVSGCACIFVPSDVLACDHIVEHIPPVNRWGLRYIIPPFLGRQSGYVYRVVAARELTRVTYTDEEVNTVILNEGEFLERNINADNASLVTSDKPVLVAQYAKGNFTDGIGDPAMIIIPPVEQYVHEVSFTNFDVAVHGVDKEYLTIITLCDDVDDLRLNGLPLGESDTSLIRFEIMSDFCILRNQIWVQGLHRITSKSQETSFAAIQYGWGIRIAYAHPVAFGMRKLTCKGYHKDGSVKYEKCKPPDTENPIIICPKNVTLYTHHEELPTLSWEQPIAVDNSDDDIEVNSNYQSGSVFPVGITRVTYEAVDSSGNTAYCSFYVTVNTVKLGCPDNQHVTADHGTSTMMVTWPEPTIEGADTRITISSNHQPGDQFPLGATIVTYIARDQVNAVVTECSFCVNVTDKEPPVIICPEKQEMFADPGKSDAEVTWDAPTVSDNSGHVIGMNISHVPGGSFRIGRTVVVYTVWDLAGNTGTCSFNVVVYARCPAEVTNITAPLSWPVTTAGHTAESQQRCPVNTEKGGYAVAVRYCSPADVALGARWEDPLPQACGMLTTNVQLQELQKVPVVQENVQEVADALVEVTGHKNVTRDELSAVAKTLENIVSVESPSIEVTESVVEVVDNFMESISANASDESLSDNANSSSSILRALEDQVSMSLQAGHQIRTVKPNIAVEGIQLKQNTTKGDLSFAVLSSNSGATQDQRYLKESGVQVFQNISNIPLERVQTSIKLPQSLLNEIREDMQISFMVFQEDVLFPSEKIRNGNNKLAGSIISASIENVNVVNLTDPVVIEFAPTKISTSDFDFNHNTTGCFFYDKKRRDWSNEGCEAVWSDDVAENGRIVCYCDHLTNFAVIVDWTGQSGIDDPKLAFALDVISKLGCALSVIALTITLIIFLLFRRLRANRPRHILIHFCFSLWFLYLIFLTGIDASNATGCTFVAALLHFFTLTTIAWMGVEARNMYVTLVKVFDAEDPNFMIWACALAWGAPALVIVTTVSAAFHNYRNKDYCFMSPGPALYFGLIVPAAAVLVHNFMTFGLVMRRLLRANLGGTVKEKSRFRQLSMRLQNALVISILLGLTWVFGFLAIDDATFTFQLLFCLFNAFQGVIVFVLFCLRQEDVQKTLIQYFTWVKCPKWTLPRWKAVPTKDTTTTSNGSAPPSSPTRKVQVMEFDMASTTDVSMSEARIPLQS